VRLTMWATRSAWTSARPGISRSLYFRQRTRDDPKRVAGPSFACCRIERDRTGRGILGMIWYAFIVSLVPRTPNGGRRLLAVYRAAPPVKPSIVRRFRFPRLALVLAASGILGICCIGLAAHTRETRLSMGTSSRSPMCVMAQMSARPGWAHRPADYCAM
jgi:hypothetical protein